jgi:hypothetical protein
MFQADRQADMTKVTVAFRNFPNATKIRPTTLLVLQTATVLRYYT